MPKVNARAKGPEADVAARIAMERERHGLTAAALARRMTALGCKLDPSAINKIEQGQPPRRISVDELVAFAKVFDLDIQDLLVPAHAARDREIERAYRAMREAAEHAAVSAQMCRIQLERLDELVSLGSLSDLSQPLQAVDAALDALEQAVAGVSDEVRDRLRRDPAGAPGAKALRRPTGREQRAAQAASPPKRSR